MKTWITILIFVLPFSLFAQDRFIEIPEKDAPALKQYKINWHTGIDPVKTKAGTWVLPEKVIDLIPKNILISDATEKVVTTDLREYLISRPKVILQTKDFSIPKIETAEPKIIER